MELKEAVEKLNNFKSEKLERDKLEINPRGGFKIGAIYKYTELDKAIDTVLEELDNRIPRKDIEDLKEKIHWELDKNGITRGYQIIIDEYFNKLLNKE